MQLAGTFIPVAEITSASQIWDINTNNHKPNRKSLSTFLQEHSLINLAFLQKHSLINYLRMETYHQLKNFYFLKSFTLLFIHFVQKHSFTEFKNFFCLNSSVLQRSVFVDISKRDVASFDDALYFVGKFTLNYDPVKVNAFCKQFLHYQMLNDHDISNSLGQNSCNYYNEKAKYYKCYI